MRNSNLIKLICLILSLFIAISLLGACSKTTNETAENSSEPSSDSTDDFEEDVDDEAEDEDDNYDDDYSSDEYDEPVEEDDSDDYGDDEDDYYNDYYEDEEDYGNGENVETLKVYNAEAPILDNYRGMSSTVYHAYGHMLDDKTGRVYTDEMLDLELNRLADAGVRFCRTRYTTLWAWDDTTGGWNWDSNRMTYYWTYCRNLQDRGINVVHSVGWHLGCHTHLVTGSIDEHGYITKSENYPEDLYGESVGYDFSKCKNEEYARMAKESLRLGEAQAQLILEAKSRGINNITHFLYFTEPSYATTLSPNMPTTDHPAYGFEGGEPEEYIFIVQTIQKKLKDRGVYDMVKHVGPNQGSIKHGDGLLRYMLERDLIDMFDVWSAHFYPDANNATDNVYYDVIDPVFESYLQPLKDVGEFKNVEFWVDEFYCRAQNSKLGSDNAWCGLQMAVGGIIAQQRGINNISLWQIFDQLWTDQTNTGGEFINGIHACGSCPSLFVSSIPRGQYYSTSLFAKYNGYQNGKSYRTNNAELQENIGDVHVGAVQLEDGSWTITVVNSYTEPYRITVEFDKAINQTLYRHVNNVNTNVCTTAAHLADADKTFVNVKDKFTDIIEPGAVAIYTGVKG